MTYEQVAPQIREHCDRGLKDPGYMTVASVVEAVMANHPGAVLEPVELLVEDALSAERMPHMPDSPELRVAYVTVRDGVPMLVRLDLMTPVEMNLVADELRRKGAEYNRRAKRLREELDERAGDGG